MASDVTLYHNPRCSTSRAGLQRLRDRGFEPQVALYLETPPTVDELNALLAKLGLEPRELMRRKEKVYAELGLDDPALSREDLVQAMVEHPILIERPIAVRGDRAALGRPVERIDEVLE